MKNSVKENRRWIALMLTVVILATGNSEIMSFWGSSYKVYAAEMAEGNAKEAGKMEQAEIFEEGQLGDGDDAKDMAVLLASGDNIASGVIDEDYGHITWVIDANGKLTVEGTGDFADPNRKTYSGIPWRVYSTAILSAEIDVTGMKNASAMFDGCDRMVSADLSHFDTSQVTSMSRMFYDCSRLSSLDVSHFDTNKVKNMYGMFTDCSGLSSLDVSHFDTSQVTFMLWMFNGCSGLSSLDVSHFDTSQVTNMFGMFAGCCGLSSLDVSCFDTSKVTTMNEMFYGCSGLSSLDVSHFNTSKVTDMYGMFYGCSGLSSLDVSHFDTSQVTDMTKMFMDCSGLRSLDVSHFNTSKVTDMTGMFMDCSGLNSLDVSHFSTSKVRYMGEMFFGCSSLTNLDLGNFDMTNLKNLANNHKGLFGDDWTDRILSLNTVYTPCNLSLAMPLPTTDPADVWYRSDGSIVTELPQGLDHSVALGKNYIPEEKSEPEPEPTPAEKVKAELVDAGEWTFRFLDAETGNPIQNGDVLVYLNNKFTQENMRYYKTDANGCIQMPLGKECEVIRISTCDSKTGFKGYKGLSSEKFYPKNYQKCQMVTYRLKPRADKYLPYISPIKANASTTGPEVDTGEGKLSLFNLDTEFELNLGYGIKYKTTYDAEKQTVKVVFSTEQNIKDYDAIKNEFKNTTRLSLDEEWNKMLASTDKTGKAVKGKVKYVLTGFMEMDKSGRPTESGFTVAVKGEDSFEYRPASLGGVFYGKFVLAITGEGKYKVTYVDGNMPISGALKIEPALTIAVGMGWSLAHIEGGATGKMTGTLKMPWKNVKESLAIDLSAEIYWEGKFLFCGEKQTLWSGSTNLWPGKSSNSGSGGGSRSLSPYNIMPVYIPSDTLTVMPRDYLASNGTGIPSAVRADGADNLSPVYAGGTGALSAADSFRYSEVSADSGVFPENNVQYVQLAGGTEILAWVHDFGDKSDTNRTTLVYSVNKNDGTGWGSITPVCSDTSTGDYYPTMVAEGDKAYLVWNKASEVFGDTADADHAMKHMDVCLSVFENGAFTAPELLSAPSNDVMEFSPMVAADGEKVAVAWLVNSENDYHYTKGSNALYVREYRNGAWGDEVCFAKGLHFVSDYDLGYVDGQVAVAYAEDADGVSDTEDGTAHLVVAGMRDTSKIADTKAAAAAAAMAAASGTVTDTVVCDGSYNATMVDICGNALYFSGKDGICKASGKGFSHISDTGIKTDNFVVARNAVGGEAVTFLAQDGYTSNIYVSYCRDGSYTSPVSLVADGSRVTHYVPLCNADGTVSVAYNEDEVLTGAEYPYGLTDMVVKRKAEPDLFFVDDTLVYNAYDVAPGGKLEFSALAHNYTSQDVTAVQATLKGSVSGTVYEGKLDAAIPVGESAYVTVPYTLPGTVVNENFTLTLTPVDFADKDLSDNAAICELGYSDIAVTECRIENNIITGTVKNVGYKTASNVTLAIREDDQDQEPFAALTYTGGSLAVGESWEFTQAVTPVTYQSPSDAKYYLVTAGTDSTQNNYANDSATIHSEPVAATGIALDRTTLAMTEKTTAILTPTVAPATATFKEVKYTSGDNSVVLVDGEGNLYAVGVGSTVVTVYTADCNYSAECTVTVEAMAEGTTGKDYVLSDRGLDLELGEEAELALMEDPAGSDTSGSGGSSGSSASGTAVTGAVWSSTDEQVVTVDGNGKVTAAGEGIALVTVRAGAYVDACIVRVRDYSIKQLCCEEDSMELAIGDSFQLDVSILPENTTMSKALAYASEDETVAAVDAKGLVTAVSEGSTTVTVTSVNGVVLRIPVMVSEPFIYTIRLDAAGGEKVEPLKIRAQKVVTQDEEIYSEDYIAYPESIPETRRKGYMFKGWYSERDGKGALLDIETPIRGDAVYYAHWEEAVYKVTLDKESMELKLGESAQLHASVTPDDGAEVVYSTENSSIVTVTEKGLVTGVGLGTAVVTVTAGNGTASCRITVTEGQEKPGTDEGTDEGNDQPGLHVKLPDGLIYTYTGSPIKPRVIVTNNGSRLTEGVDYTVKYSANVNAADQNAGKKAPKITITGKGSFAGSASVNFTIRPKSFADGIGRGSSGAEGSGSGGIAGGMTGNSGSLPELWYPLELHAAENTKAAPVLFYGIKRLGSRDYDLSTDAAKVVKPGKVTGDGKLYLIGKGNFTGVAEIKVKAVANAALKKLAVSPKKGFQPVYDGKEHKPVFGGSGADVEVTAKGAAGELKEEKDYHVVYSEDVTNAGTVKYFVVGMGDCIGVVGKSYKINPVKGSEADFKVDFTNKSSGYAYSPASVTVNNLAVTYTGGQGGGKALTPGRDYKAAYSNNKKVGTAKLKITFLGNYKGSKAKMESFTITQGYLDAKGHEAKVAVPDKVYKKAGVYNSAPVVAVDGVLVKASDYKLSYEYQDSSGKWQSMDGSNKLDLEKLGKDSAVVRVKITGAGNYSSDAAHSLTAEYRVHKLGEDGIDLSKAKVTFYDEKDNKNKFAYTGKEVVPHRTEVTCKVGKDNIALVEGKDYNVTYVNNVGKGKAVAVITGTAAAGSGGKVFCGSKSAGFAITSMNLRDSAVFDNVSAAGSRILEFLLEAAY